MIYIVEDDTAIRQMEGYALKTAGFNVLELKCGAELDAVIKSALPKLIVLDLMLPGEDGLSILRRLRSNEETARIPVVIVTAKSTELDTVRGLDDGADDYITKPFGVIEFVSRIKAVLRRAGGTDKILRCGSIALDTVRHEVTVQNVPCTLTYKEFCLLRYMLNNMGIVLTREVLMHAVWGEDFLGETRTVDMHIKSLRKKLGSEGEKITTVRNVGYKLNDK